MKLGFLITARLKSSRLPLKLLLDLKGKTIVERVIERAKKVAFVEDIILCTSTNNQDRPLVDISLNNNIYYYLGSEEDVLQRLLDAAQFFDLDYIVNITGENPLFSIQHANEVANALRTHHHDFVYIEGLPIGCGVYGLSTNALKVICNIKQVIDTEIWGPLINRPDIFNVGKIEVNEFYNKAGLRITSDYPEDYQFISEVYSHFSPNEIPTYHQVVELINKKPELLDIHAHRTQLALDPAIVQKINTYYDNNRESILKLKQQIYNS